MKRLILLVAVLVLLAPGPGLPRTAASLNDAPTASFTATASSSNPLQIDFDASGSSDPDGTIVSYAWDFGDSSPPGSGQATSHTYAAQGTYQVVLTVTDDGGASDQETQSVKVNLPPTAVFTWARDDDDPLTVDFDASGSNDPAPGAIVSYAWDFGDGSAGMGLLVSHKYAQGAAVSVTLTVTDSDGATASLTQAVRPNARPEPSFLAAPVSASDPLRIAFDATGSKDADGTIASYAWDFGDGGEASGPQPTHVYENGGAFDVTLTVRDDLGAEAELVREIEVNEPPEADFDFEISEENRFRVELDGSRSTDPDGDIVSWAWDFGDGTGGSGEETSHVYARPGRYEVRLTVTDDKGGTAAATQTVRINAPPVAAFTFTLSADNPLEIELDASASFDPDGRIDSYDWELGDGGEGRGKIETHEYDRYGSYSVTLTVTDDDDASAKITRRVAIVLGRGAVLVSLGRVLGEEAAALVDGDGRVLALECSLGARVAAALVQALRARVACADGYLQLGAGFLAGQGRASARAFAPPGRLASSLRPSSALRKAYLSSAGTIEARWQALRRALAALDLPEPRGEGPRRFTPSKPVQASLRRLLAAWAQGLEDVLRVQRAGDRLGRLLLPRQAATGRLPRGTVVSLGRVLGVPAAVLVDAKGRPVALECSLGDAVACALAQTFGTQVSCRDGFVSLPPGFLGGAEGVVARAFAGPGRVVAALRPSVPLRDAYVGAAGRLADAWQAVARGLRDLRLGVRPQRLSPPRAARQPLQRLAAAWLQALEDVLRVQQANAEAVRALAAGF